MSSARLEQLNLGFVRTDLQVDFALDVGFPDCRPMLRKFTRSAPRPRGLIGSSLLPVPVVPF